MTVAWTTLRLKAYRVSAVLGASSCIYEFKAVRDQKSAIVAISQVLSCLMLASMIEHNKTKSLIRRQGDGARVKQLKGWVGRPISVKVWIVLFDHVTVEQQ